MATVTSMTADRMLAIEQQSIVTGFVDVNGKLLLQNRAGTQVDAGLVKGDPGAKGNPGATGPAGPLIPGIVVLYPTQNAPNGWLVCDGRAVQTSAYTTLFSIIGYQYGGTGAVFNLPDLRGRVPVGRDVTQPEFNVHGKNGGTKTHQLTVDEMPAHTHTLNRPTGNVAVYGAQVGAEFVVDYLTGSPDPVRRTHPAGKSLPHNNLQPYLTMEYIIKT